MRIAIATDHAGFTTKEALKHFLEAQGHVVKDYGTFNQESCDYPDYAQAVAEGVAQGREEKGVLVCGAGIGMSVAANKVPGIRAALCHDLYTARMSREHNDANVLVLPARIVAEPLAEEILKVFFSTSFEGGRHANRLKKIEALERKYNKP
jgi:ribose 5-phosphate isomerase B